MLAPYQIAQEVGQVAAGEVIDFFASESGQVFMARLAELGIDPQSDNYAPQPAVVPAGAGAPLARAMPVGPTEADFTAETSTAGLVARSGIANSVGSFTTMAAEATGAVFNAMASA